MSHSPRSTRPPIAVVGVSALFPGSVDSTGFWNDILAGTDRMSDIPTSHWLIEDHYDADPSTPDRTYGRRGGFLDSVDFDAMAFGVPPSVVPSTDTAQLLALIVAQRVLDDATRGQFTELDRSRASVILGVTSGQELFGAMASRMNRPMWLQGMRRAGIAENVAQEACDRILALHPEWTESTFPGLLGNVVAGRIANRLDLGGTNCVTDAACASSFSAISMGVNELYLGDSDLVIAGGVDTMNDIFMYMCFSKTPALSKSGDIRPFSDQADGTMLGEGIGMVALKRLEDAERDGNDIYCVVNGVGASSDGRSKSVYAPVSSGQARALGNAYDKAGYGPDTVELVEAHGTGTVAGDAAEFGGLQLAFDATERSRRQWCALGSVKSQIGHTKAAAGAAGLFKVVMALHHKVLPQTAKIDQPNPELDLESSPFHLNTTTRPWVRGSDHERRGSVSSFGFGGSNFHIALSEYTGGGAHAPRLRTSDVEMVVICGRDAADVAAQARRMADEFSDERLVFLAQSSQRAYDSAQPARLAVVAGAGDLRDKLELAVDMLAKRPDAAFSTPNGVHFGIGDRQGDVGFLFPGQGSQYVGMGADLAMNFSGAMAAWDLAAEQEWDDTSLHDVVFPITSFEDGAASGDQSLLTATHWAQPAIGTMSLSLLALLDSIGLDAQHVGGHSFGEITALHAGGVLGTADMIRVARRRGTLMAEASQSPGSMTAVAASVASVQPILDASDADVVIANHNSHRQVVLSGPTDAIECIEAALATHGITATRLPVATAFHSSVVSGAGAAFGEFLDDIAFGAPTIPVHANETAEPYHGDEAAMRSQLAHQLSNTVRFVEMIESMYDAGTRTFVEVGPSSVLTGLVGDILHDREHRAISLDKKKTSGLVALHDGLGQLVAAGVHMDLDGLWLEYGDIADPADTPAPKLAVAINGANYDSPYPPHDLNELAEANPVTTPPPAAAPVPTDPPAATPTAPPTAAPAVPPAAAATPVAVADPTVLAAYQHAQQQTAAAHTAYLDSMAQAHRAFLDAAQQGIAVLGQLAGGTAPTASASSTPPLDVPAPIPAPATIAAQPPIPAVPTPTPTPTPPAPAPAPAFDTAPTLRPSAPTSPVAPAASPATSPAAPAVSMTAADMTPKLLSVVSDRTGYPADMLTMDMELESDLGIDSIKRVEILSAMQDLVPELPDVDLGVMANLSTLGEIVDYLTEQTNDNTNNPSNADAADAAPASANDERRPAGAFGRFVTCEQTLDPDGSPLPGLFDTSIAIVGDPDGVGTALAATLAAAGVHARLVEANATGDHDGVIYLGNLRRAHDPSAASRLNHEAFDVARTYASRGAPNGVFVAVDDQHGSPLPGGGDATQVWASGLVALLRTAAIEWPTTSTKYIDIERNGRSADALAGAIAAELLTGGSVDEIELRSDGTRIGHQSEPVDVVSGAMPIGTNDVIVVSGGGRGVTAATTIELARASKATFVLLGRTPLTDEPAHYRDARDDAALKRTLLAESQQHEPLSPAALRRAVDAVLANREIRATLAAIENLGGRAIYETVDITDAGAVARSLTSVRTEIGAITGVIHGAGVLADKLIADKSDDQFATVFDTKVQGLMNLLDATADDRLSILCLFSSVAARTGNVGQADYAMANEVLNRVAMSEWARRDSTCVVKSIGWGPWAGGMVTPSLADHFDSMGVALIGLEEGARMLVDELSSPQTDQVDVVLGGGVLGGGVPGGGVLAPARATARVDA